MKGAGFLYSIVLSIGAWGQDFDVLEFDSTSAGPWSDISKTITGVAKVANDSIIVDGKFTSAEYGGIGGVNVTPGVNAWILDFPGDRQWDDAADSSFTFWLAHDDSYFYVAVRARDDVVNSDDLNHEFWKDDAIEIVTDVFNDRFDINTDQSNDLFGGHNYVNYLGRFSRWNDETNERIEGIWTTGVEWTYGEEGDIWGIGGEVEGGWEMEVRFHKRMFESPEVGNQLRHGARMGFNIGLDDDDQFGPGTNGDASRTQDLELQYFWANRERTLEWNEDARDEYVSFEGELSLAYFLWETDPFYDRGINSRGRLTHGGTGEIIFGFDPLHAHRPEILFLTNNADSPLRADPYLIALLEASGYNVSLHSPAASSMEEVQATRDAAEGKDLVIISETIGSTSVVFDEDDEGEGLPVFILKNAPIPVISFEAYMWDEADWVGRDQFNEFGNTGRNEVHESIQEALTNLYIQSPEHPMAAGLEGSVKVYDAPYSANWGNVGSDATIVTSVLSNGSYPSDFVYEKGDALVDGSIAPAKRIGIFLGQAGNLLVEPDAGNLRYAYLSEAGRRLFINAVAYAIDSGGVENGSMITGIRFENGAIVIEGSGSVASADSPEGPFSGSIPLPATIQPESSARFFKAN